MTLKTKPQIPCSWCPDRFAIQSHIIPASLLRTASEILCKRYELRSVLNPNLVVQGTGKPYLLCPPCDNSFSPAEHIFREKFYAPLLRRATTEFEYQDWLLKFATSLGWKRLKTGLPLFNDLDATVVENAQDALKYWESYLRGDTDDPGPYQHHLFITNGLDKNEIEQIEWLTFTEIFETTVIPLPSGLQVWTIVPGCIMVSFAYPSDAAPWDCSAETQIALKGKFGPNQTLPGTEVLSWSKAAENHARGAVGKLSDKQKQKIRSYKP